MSPSLKKRLALQRDAVAANGAGADDIGTQVDNSRVVTLKKSSTPPVVDVPAPVVELPTRTQGIPISASDDALIVEMEAFCRQRKIKVRRNSNVSLITRAGWRLLHDLMQRDPTAFAAAIEAGRPPRRVTL